jgi:ABC-type sugar transport system ATPase subunit
VVSGRHPIPPHQRDVAVVFQQYALYPHMTIRRNLEFGLPRKLARAAKEGRIRSAAEVLGITDLLDRYPAELSGGQRQRAALARAMVRRPGAFLFDEPLSNLDPALRRGARSEIKSLHKRLGTTMLYITHDQEEATVLGDRIAVVNQGVLQQVGTPEAVYRTPANAFVASFVGSPAMNLIPGALKGPGSSAEFIETVEQGQALSVAVDGRRAGQAGNSSGPFVLGVRPQALSMRPRGRGERLDLILRQVEWLGDGADLICEAPSGRRLVSRVPAGEMADVAGPIPRPISLWLDPAELHFFGEGGRNLRGSSPGGD